jgi:spore coat polysaccharide biosynthesis protein SpsF
MTKKNKTLGLIICRTGSSRLKNKIFLKLGKKTIIEILYNKLINCKNIDKIVIATTKKSEDDKVIKFAKDKNIDWFRGSENNVLKRICDAIDHYKDYNIIVRANADCPVFINEILDYDIARFKKSKFDLLSPFYKNIIPFGFSFVIFKRKTLFKIKRMVIKNIHKEHVENFCFENYKKFKIFPNRYNKKYHASNINLTLDTRKDFEKIKKLNNLIKIDSKKINPLKIIQVYK